MWIVSIVLTVVAVAAIAAGVWSAVGILRSLPRSNGDWVWY